MRVVAELAQGFARGGVGSDAEDDDVSILAFEELEELVLHGLEESGDAGGGCAVFDLGVGHPADAELLDELGIGIEFLACQ